MDRFQSPKAFSLVVDTLLKKGDLIASMGLIMQWLSQIDEVGFEAEPYSIHGLLTRWLEAAGERENGWELICRFFDYLEANADEYWRVPTLDNAFKFENIVYAAEDFPETEDEPEEEENLFKAAYDNITYRDSTDDGREDETIDDGYGMDSSEFDFLARYLEPRIKFLITVTQMWQKTAAILISSKGKPGKSFPAEKIEVIKGWYLHSLKLQEGISELMDDLWDFEIPKPSGIMMKTLNTTCSYRQSSCCSTSAFRVISAVNRLNDAWPAACLNQKLKMT